MKIENVTLGSDPEIFLVDENDTTRFISAIGKIGGTKEYPRHVGDGIALQEDCTAVEFCIPPSKTKEELVSNIEMGLLKIAKAIEGKGLNMAIVASAHFANEELLHPLAVLAGCDPDFCAWNGEANESADLLLTNLRVAGAHIHVGYENPSEEVSLAIVKAMDLFLGVPSILMDTDTERKQLYGKSGCFRFKPYGVEYRTLSNFWLKSPELIKWVFTNTQKAIEWINEDQSYLLENYRSDIVMSINNSNKEVAENLIKEFSIPVLIPETVCAD